MIDERTARMGLAACQDGGDPALMKLIEEQGAVEVWEHLRSGRRRTAMAQRAAEVKPEEISRHTIAIGARFVIPGDEEWPVGLTDLSWSEPVGGRGGQPLGLWVKGPARISELSRGISIVGSRASTAYGDHVTADLASGVAESGFPVVSGGAYGIDSAAHRGALAAHGLTVAVMASGLANYYPSGNSGLITGVAEKGAVVSEYPPSCHPSKSRFLVRNRLIAALPRATVIVEGAVRSGAQNTVSWALSLGRQVLAVPGPVTSAMSVTPHRLIRRGEAILVSTAEEILSVLNPVDTTIPEYHRAQDTLFDNLAEDKKRIHEALPMNRSVSVDELAILTGESVISLLVSLAQLKQLGFARESKPGMWSALKEK
ncbi:MAG: DNA-processing protein DprA [Propionibacteriaceae bacterium]|jgi:DNA processing protein|nr:DNA-processing protein DprA [Propionibacteriaceae bacterium]